MKEELKNIFFMGLGAMSLTSDKARELKEQLLKEGTKLYEEGKVANEELKHNIEEKIKENVTVVVNHSEPSKEGIMDAIRKMNEEERKEILALLKEEKSLKKGSKKNNE